MDDFLGGNSGSGVFNDDGTLVGILVRGLTDYVSSGDCNIVNVVPCTDSSCTSLNQGEEITYPFHAMLQAPSQESSLQLSFVAHYFFRLRL